VTEQLSLFSAADQAESNSAHASTVLPASVPPPLAQAAAALPAAVFLGTSSWSFPTWRGLVYARSYAQATLARDGLGAYARHPLLRAVGIDRTFYAPITQAEFAHYAHQVPAGFRFLVKAPLECIAPSLRVEGGRRLADNPHCFDPGFAAERFVLPAIEGLGDKAGPLVFQFPPLVGAALGEAGAFAKRLGEFLCRLPRGPIYAVELRDAVLLTADYVAVLRDTGARHCIGLHPRQPSVREQARLLEGLAPGPLVVRWNLHPDYAYEEARRRYHPFTRLIDEDLPTRVALARLCLASVRAGHAAFVVANNKAEGSAPLTVFKLAALIAEEAAEARQRQLATAGG